LQGASATEQLLREISDKDVRVFVVWAPVLATDFTAPSTAALARIPDLRAAQYWDRKRALSHLLGEHNRSTVVWDHIAVYAPGTLWQDTLPRPVYSDNPVRDVISGANDSIQRLVTSGTNPTQGNPTQGESR
jgi:hypothetical protein